MSAVAKTNEVTPLAPVNTALTPMEMLDRAVSSGAGIDVIAKLMDLQERWDKNQHRKAFDAAIADAKAELGPIIKNRQGHNSKRYADFAAIARTVDPIISKHGLSYRFRTTQDDRIHVTCVLSHRDGHSEDNTIAGPADTTGNKNAIQAIGSTLTYLQRYSLMQALGLAASEDDDGRTAEEGGPLSDEQAEKIQALIVEVAADIPRFCKYMGVARIDEINAKDFNKAIQALEAKRVKS